MISRIFGALPNSITQKLTATYFTGKILISKNKTKKLNVSEVKAPVLYAITKTLEVFQEVSIVLNI